MNIIVIICLMCFSYLYGSVPFALVVGKVFYGVDVREHGSKNLGGTNTGRVLGKKAGLAVIILDILKCFVCVSVTKIVGSFIELPTWTIYTSALSCVLGHCYPIFANFKGGKAASVMFGYALGVSFYVFAIVGLTFLGILKVTKYVSLSSMIASVVLVLCSPFFNFGVVGTLSNLFIACFLIYRHRANIERIKNKTESKITWM